MGVPFENKRERNHYLYMNIIREQNIIALIASISREGLYLVSGQEWTESDG